LKVDVPSFWVVVKTLAVSPVEFLSHHSEVLEDVRAPSMKRHFVVDNPTFRELTGGLHELSVQR